MLDLPMEENDADAKTLREYFHKLLETLMVEEEGFSGKRPFGNSGWGCEIVTTLVKHGAISGQLDDEGFLEDYDEQDYKKAWRAMLNNLFCKPIRGIIREDFGGNGE